MKLRLLTLACWSVLAFAPSSPLWADSLTTSQAATLKELDSPQGSSPSLNASPKAFVEAATDKTTATLTVADQIATYNGTQLWNLGVTVKTPFDSSKDNVKDLGSISGLTAGTNARLDIGWLYWPQTAKPTTEALDKACNDTVRKVLPGYHWATAREVIDAEDSSASAHNVAKVWNDKSASCFLLLTSDGLKQAVAAINKAAAQQSMPAVAPVDGSDKLLSEGLQNLRKANQDNFPGVFSATFSLTANRQKFSFASESAPTQINNENKTGKGATLTLSYISSTFVLNAGASYEKTFTAAQNVQICSPIGTTASTQCSNGALQAPTENSDKLVFFEYRQVFGHGNIAISPRAEYKTNTSDVGVSLPIYLVRNDKRVLDGGLTLGWTKTDHFAAGVFVGKAFSFFD